MTQETLRPNMINEATLTSLATSLGDAAVAISVDVDDDGDIVLVHDQGMYHLMRGELGTKLDRLNDIPEFQDIGYGSQDHWMGMLNETQQAEVLSGNRQAPVLRARLADFLPGAVVRRSGLWTHPVVTGQHDHDPTKSCQND